MESGRNGSVQFGLLERNEGPQWRERSCPVVAAAELHDCGWPALRQNGRSSVHFA